MPLVMPLSRFNDPQGYDRSFAEALHTCFSIIASSTSVIEIRTALENFRKFEKFLYSTTGQKIFDCLTKYQKVTAQFVSSKVEVDHKTAKKFLDVGCKFNLCRKYPINYSECLRRNKDTPLMVARTSIYSLRESVADESHIYDFYADTTTKTTTLTQVAKYEQNLTSKQYYEGKEAYCKECEKQFTYVGSDFYNERKTKLIDEGVNKCSQCNKLVAIIWK